MAPKYHQTTENWATVGSQTQLGANINMDNFSFWDLVCILPASPYSMFLQNGIGFDFLCQVFAVLNIHLDEHQSIFPYFPETSILWRNTVTSRVPFPGKRTMIIYMSLVGYVASFCSIYARCTSMNGIFAKLSCGHASSLFYVILCLPVNLRIEK